MKYVLVFGFLGLYLVLLGFTTEGWAWLMVWPGISFLLVAAAFGGAGPGVFGKRPDGTIAWWGWVLSGPYLGLTWGLWHLLRLMSREPCCHEVAPVLWLGRRVLAWELPPEVTLVGDLTAELPEPWGVATGRTYIALPTLDTRAPDELAFRKLVEKVAAWPEPVFIHCARGYGRSATLAAAVLMARGLVGSAQEAEARLRKCRPGVRLNKTQRELLRRMTSPGSS